MRRVRQIARKAASYGLLAAALACVGGCDQSAGLRGCRVEGELKIDNEPAELALITLVPIAPTVGPKASGIVRQGKYVIEAEDGPYPGEFLVKIESVPFEIEAMAARRTGTASPINFEKPRPLVAPRYNRDSTTTVIVQQDAENRFDFEVESVPAAQQKGGL